MPKCPPANHRITATTTTTTSTTTTSTTATTTEQRLRVKAKTGRTSKSPHPYTEGMWLGALESPDMDPANSLMIEHCRLRPGRTLSLTHTLRRK
ncbi:hypothetical protein K440DRAFT_618070 [Wilcoxina mikolae CBS 423.85]|nr:hypothetical protein K440DRAFT_618070 [Wilcoxina mikolae CBS 423.85]